MTNKTHFSRNLVAAVAAAGIISLATTAVAIFSFRRALHSGEAVRIKHAADLVLCHELAQLLERKLAKSRTFILTGDEAFAQEMEDARSEFSVVLGELNGSVRVDEGRALLKEIGVLEARHHEILRGVMAMRRRGARPSEVAPALMDRLKPVRDDLDLAIKQLIVLKESQLRLAESAAEESVRDAQKVSIAAGLSSLLALLVVLWLVRRLASAQVEIEQALRRSNAELDTMVAERTQELSAFNRELESFSYSVAHDLRTPLRAITNYSDLAFARAQAGADAVLKDNVGRIRSAGLRMSQLIDALLALSRLTRRPLSPSEIDMSALATEIGTEIAATNSAHDVTFSVQPRLRDLGDPDLIRAAVYNLVDNAWKFSATTTRATIEFGRMAVLDTPAYFVRDNGAGFDERFAEKLFRPFERLHSFSEFPGTGIGLATVERVIHRHGGSVWAEGALGQGATFFFTLNHRIPQKERTRRVQGGQDAR